MDVPSLTWRCRNTTGFRWLGLILDAYTGWVWHKDQQGYFWWALRLNFLNRHPWFYKPQWWFRRALAPQNIHEREGK